MARFSKQLLIITVCLTLAGCRGRGPTEAELARDEGISYMGAGDYENAIAAFEQAYGLCDKKMPQTKTDIALYEAACSYKLGDFDAVKDTCSKALALGDNADAYYLRAVAFLQTGEMDAAKADFDAASLLAPENYELFFNIYKQYEQKNLSAVGDEYLQKALHIEGEEMEDDYQKGSIYFYLNDYTMAQQMLAKPADAKHKNAMLLMGQVYLKLDDSVHARNMYQQYMEEYGDDAQSYNGIVLCELADGNYDAAVSMAEAGLALEGSDSEKCDLLYNEVIAYERKHDFEAAKEAAARLLEQYPDDAVAQKEYDFLVTR